MINTTRLRLAWLLAMLAILCAANQAHASPPLGLTPIPPSTGSLEIIDDTTFIGTPGGITRVSANGAIDFIPIVHPTLSPLFFATGVVKANDNRLYTAASYGNVFNPSGGALFSLDEPSNPLVTWEGSYRVQGVDRNLTVYGNLTYPTVGFSQASRFLLDGSVVSLPFPPGADNPIHGTYLSSSTPQGYVLGDTGIPGTIGSSPALWDPDGKFNGFLFGSDIPGTIRDRNDGDGINVSNTFRGIILGASDIRTVPGTPGYTYYSEYYVRQAVDESSIGESNIIVSHSDFVVIDEYDNSGLYAFYPGIVPGFPDRAVPLLDIFPDLATIDIDRIHNLASVDGFLYMTLSGSDGTFLFGARDPSVIPEPTTALLLLTALPYLARRKSWR